MNKAYMNQQNISRELLCLSDKLDFLKLLYESRKLPRTLMLSGKKGCGKFTLIFHFMNYIFDKKNYDYKNKKILKNEIFYNQFISNIFPNIIYLPGSNLKSLKIDDIRNLKSQILKTSILNGERFVIFDDVELLNKNSFNALLKIIEEPTSNNYFIMINNQTKPILETIHSRCIEVKIFLKKEQIIKIIEHLITTLHLKPSMNHQMEGLTPGNFLSFNQICNQNNINLKDTYLKNLALLLNLFKKSRNKDFINFILFLTDFHFYNLKKRNFKNNEILFDQRKFVIENMNNFINYNINQNSLMTAISNKLSNE